MLQRTKKVEYVFDLFEFNSTCQKVSWFSTYKVTRQYNELTTWRVEYLCMYVCVSNLDIYHSLTFLSLAMAYI